MPSGTLLQTFATKYRLTTLKFTSRGDLIVLCCSKKHSYVYTVSVRIS